MSATPAIRTVVGNGSTSQEAQDYIHQFPIILINLGGVAKLYIGMKDSAQELWSVTELLDGGSHIGGKSCIKIALFGCDAFSAAANELGAHYLLHFICQQRKELQRLDEKEDNKKEDDDKEDNDKEVDDDKTKIKALKGNRDWMNEIVALWKAFKAEGYIERHCEKTPTRR